MYSNLNKWYKKQQIQKDNKINKIIKLILLNQQLQYLIINKTILINFQKC